MGRTAEGVGNEVKAMPAGAVIQQKIAALIVIRIFLYMGLRAGFGATMHQGI